MFFIIKMKTIAFPVDVATEGSVVLSYHIMYTRLHWISLSFALSGVVNSLDCTEAIDISILRALSQ